jgi:hypothetical protein
MKMLRGILKRTAIALLAMASVGAASATAGAAICGDLNNNGSRNVADVVLLFRAVLENPDPSPLCGGAGALDCGDVLKDGAISVNDVVVLFSSVLGNETLFNLCEGPGPDIACPGGTTTISSLNGVTSNQTWPAGCTVLLDGPVFVQSGVVLTIKAGAVVKGMKNPTTTPPSALIFRRDSKINAVGTAASPIVFTSDQAPGSRFAGDWGGLVLNGRSTVNCPGNECLAEGLTSVPFGGTEPNDSSGILRYARVEFAGRILSTDNELNVLTMNGIGRGTSIDHVQAHMGLDDALEWFGGTVNAKYMVGTAAADDLIDWQLGTSGATQYVYAAQWAGNLDAAGSNGFEADNNENLEGATPRSNPKFCNVTVVGCRNQGGNCNVSTSGALLRRGTAGQIWKTIITHMGSSGMQMRDVSTANNACNAGPTLTGNLIMKDTMFFDNGSGGTTHCSNHSSTAAANCQSCDIYNLWKSSQGVVDGSDPGLGTGFGSSPIPNANANSAAADCATLDPFFDSTSYRGSHQPGGSNWMAGWTSFALN